MDIKLEVINESEMEFVSRGRKSNVPQALVDAIGKLAKGKVAVMMGEDVEVIEAPACVEIKAGLTHGIKALTDCVWFCVHATDEKDPSKVDDILIGV